MPNDMKRYLFVTLAQAALLITLQFSQPVVPEPVVYWKVVGVPVEVVKEVEVTREVAVYYPIYKPYEVVKEVTVEVRPTAERAELIKAYETIEKGIYSHQFYAMNPALQTPVTGGTALNWQWVEDYRLLQELIERAYGEVE